MRGGHRPTRIDLALGCATAQALGRPSTDLVLTVHGVAETCVAATAARREGGRARERDVVGGGAKEGSRASGAACRSAHGASQSARAVCVWTVCACRWYSCTSLGMAELVRPGALPVDAYPGAAASVMRHGTSSRAAQHSCEIAGELLRYDDMRTDGSRVQTGRGARERGPKTADLVLPVRDIAETWREGGREGERERERERDVVGSQVEAYPGAAMSVMCHGTGSRVAQQSCVQPTCRTIDHRTARQGSVHDKA